MDVTNLYIVACQDRIVFHIASMANTRMSLSHSRYLQCYFKIRYIHDALRPGYATIRNVTVQPGDVGILTLEGIRGGGVNLIPPPLKFFGFNFLFLDRLPKALAQLFFVC